MATIYKVDCSTRKPIFIGVQEENESNFIQFDITPWVEKHGAGVATANAKAPNSTEPYPVIVQRDGNIVTWKPKTADVAIEGVGAFQLIYTVGEVVARTQIWTTNIGPSLIGSGDPPDPISDYIDDMREIAAETLTYSQNAEESADAAAQSATEAAASVSDIETDLKSVEISVDYQIGTNAYLNGTTLIFSTLASRGSVYPLRVPKGGGVIVDPKSPYILAVMACKSGNWDMIDSDVTGAKAFDLSTYEFFCVQIKANAEIPQDAKPFKLFYVIAGQLPSSEDILDTAYPMPATFEIGVNRYVSGGTLYTGANPIRASIIPMQLACNKIKVTPRDYIYWYSVLASTNGTTWEVLESGSYDEKEYDLSGYKQFCMGIGAKDNRTIPSNAKLPDLFYVDYFEDVADCAALNQNVNSSDIWEIGSFGSAGEPYDVRNNEIRTKYYLPVDEISSITFDSSALTYFCVYDENKGFIDRATDVPKKIVNKYIRNRWANARYAKFTIWVDNTPATDVSNYSLASINTVNATPLPVPDVVQIQNYKKEQAEVFKIMKTSAELFADCDAKLLFMTDVHSEKARLKRAVKLANAWGNSFISAVVNGGDTAQLIGSEDLSWYDDEVATLSMPILNTVGNHDAWSSLQGDLLSKTAVYNAVIAPIVSHSGITQPANASENGYNYYYKDFNSKVRVIVLDCMFWDSTQKTWFINTLSNAKTNGLHVVCVSHASFPWADMTWVDTLWSKSGCPGGYSNSAMLADPTRLSIEAGAAVKDFMDNGGKFVCWLTGHQHGDDVHKLPDYGDQYVVTMPSFAQRASQLQKSGNEFDYNFDCLTYIAVDTSNEVIKFMRIGADIDMFGVKHSGLSIKYSNNTVIASW